MDEALTIWKIGPETFIGGLSDKKYVLISTFDFNLIDRYNFKIADYEQIAITD